MIEERVITCTQCTEFTLVIVQNWMLSCGIAPLNDLTGDYGATMKKPLDCHCQLPKNSSLFFWDRKTKPKFTSVNALWASLHKTAVSRKRVFHTEKQRWRSIWLQHEDNLTRRWGISLKRMFIYLLDPALYFNSDLMISYFSLFKGTGIIWNCGINKRYC